MKWRVIYSSEELTLFATNTGYSHECYVYSLLLFTALFKESLYKWFVVSSFDHLSAPSYFGVET